VKHDVLDVLDGPVDSEAAVVAMARGVGRVLEADVAVAVTGSVVRILRIIRTASRPAR
jgi:nicotinamide-nucleotide amidase